MCDDIFTAAQQCSCKRAHPCHTLYIMLNYRRGVLINRCISIQKKKKMVDFIIVREKKNGIIITHGFAAQRNELAYNIAAEESARSNVL